MVEGHDFKKFPELTNSQMIHYELESPHPQIKESFQARVVSVHDGDTIRVLWEDRDFSFPVRFLDTQAPELKHPGGRESQEWLEELILNEEVEIQIDPDNRVGKWGRILGRVIHVGLNVNDLSILLGFARPFEEGKNAVTKLAEIEFN